MVAPVSAWPAFDGIQIDQRLSAEGVVETYSAAQASLGRRVLVKALKPNVLPSSPFASALRREAQILGELSHQHVQKLYDFRCTDTQMWLVLEGLEGLSLAEVLASNGQLPPLAVVSLGFMVATALSHCHQKGVVHRSVQPLCLNLARTGSVTLVGFVGAVKDRLPTAPELLDGSPHLAVSPYFSPEQILGESVDARSDIFSLGVVLYEALTGKNPFAGPDDRSVAQRIRKDKAPPASRFVRGIPGALERAIGRCLEKMPQDRFATAEELALALEALLRENEVTSPTTELKNAILPVFEPKLKSASNPLPETKTRAPRSLDPISSGLLGMMLGSLLIVGGGYVLLGKPTGDVASTRRSSSRLELLPENPANLRIVADPWADVSVDGQAIGTTPIGRPVALPAGTHYVQLEHPRASIERRTVRLSAGETVLLEVKMNVAPSSSALPALSAQVPDAGASP